MKKQLLLQAGILFLQLPACFSQTLRQPVAAVYLGMGAYSTKHADVFSFGNNQAALTQVKRPAIGIYSERRFLLQAASLYAAAIALPSRLGNFGISLQYFGFKDFNESRVGLAYARSVGKKLDLGVQFNYYSYKVPAYFTASAIGFEMAAVFHLTDKLNAGVHACDPVGGKFSKTGEKLTSEVTLGMGYDASERFFVSAEMVKREDCPVNMNAGLQYNFMKRLFARAGICSATSMPYAGLGISWNNFRLDISSSYHPQLAFSPGLLLLMQLGKMKDE